MKRIPTLVSILGAVLVIGFAATLSAEERCSLRSVAGDFGYTVTGWRLPVGPAASVGSVHFNRDGTLSGTQTLSLNGTIVQGEVLTGTITVNDDCTGSSVIVVSNTPFPRTTTVDVVWVNDSDEFRLIFTNSGTILTADGKRLHHGND